MRALSCLKLVIIAVLAAIFAIGPVDIASSSLANPAKGGHTSSFVPEEAVVGFTEEGGARREDLVRKHGGTIKEEEPLLKIVLAKVSEGKEIQFIEAIKAEEEVRYAELIPM